MHAIAIETVLSQHLFICVSHANTCTHNAHTPQTYLEINANSSATTKQNKKKNVEKYSKDSKPLFSIKIARLMKNELEHQLLPHFKYMHKMHEQRTHSAMICTRNVHSTVQVSEYISAFKYSCAKCVYLLGVCIIYMSARLLVNYSYLYFSEW